MDVFKELTGIDLGDMQEQRAKNEEKRAETDKKQQENEAQREKERRAREQAEEEARLPSEAKLQLQREKDAEVKKNEGNDFYKKKDFAKAIELYKAAIELNPKEIMYYSNLAAVYIEQKNYDLAMAELEAALQVAKSGQYDFVKLAKVLARKASVFEKMGKLEEAIETYKQALLEDNSSTIKDSMKKCEKAKKEYDIKAYINPEIAEQHKEKGTAFFAAGDFPSAMKEFEEGLRRDPKNKAIYNNRCACYIKLMEPNQGLKDAEKALEIDPLFVRAWARKGTCHQMMKEYHKAIDAFDKGL